MIDNKIYKKIKEFFSNDIIDVSKPLNYWLAIDRRKSRLLFNSFHVSICITNAHQSSCHTIFSLDDNIFIVYENNLKFVLEYSDFTKSEIETIKKLFLANNNQSLDFILEDVYETNNCGK